MQLPGFLDNILNLRHRMIFQIPVIGDRDIKPGQAANGSIEIVKRLAFDNTRDKLSAETARLDRLMNNQRLAGLDHRLDDRLLIQRLQGRRVYLTIDVDGLDPAIVSATGTPEPDGLTWRETLDILRTVTQTAQIVGIDCVELAPAAGQHAADFAVAKLLYKTISFALEFGSKIP